MHLGGAAHWEGNAVGMTTKALLCSINVYEYLASRVDKLHLYVFTCPLQEEQGFSGCGAQTAVDS